MFSLDGDQHRSHRQYPALLCVSRSLQTRVPRAKVLLFASGENKDEFVEAMKQGCSGILLKESSVSLIEKSIQRVFAGEIWLDSTTTAAVSRDWAATLLVAPKHR